MVVRFVGMHPPSLIFSLRMIVTCSSRVLLLKLKWFVILSRDSNRFMVKLLIMVKSRLCLVLTSALINKMR